MSKRAPREAISRERVLKAALAVVDREGLEAITMRRVGEELGIEAMSLYNHVENKAAILDGIFEIVLAELPQAKAAGSWQSALRARAKAFRRTLQAHPNALPLFANRPAVTPAAISHVEEGLVILREAGFTPSAALSAFQVLAAFVVGHTMQGHHPAGVPHESRPSYQRLSPGEFPRVREAAAVLLTHDVEGEFEFGLDVLLAGLEVQRDSRVRARSKR
jgi:AcrR family transcriptional regulator